MNGYDPSTTGSAGYKTFDFWILGDPFLRSYYSIHDIENYSIGIVGLVSFNKDAKEFVPPDLTSTSNDNIVSEGFNPNSIATTASST
jgi:hypothetical protein